jgi:hypothetical protein
MFLLLIWVFGRTKHHSSGMMVDFSSEIRAGMDTKSQTTVAQVDTSACAVQIWWGLPKSPFTRYRCAPWRTIPLISFQFLLCV